MAPPSRSRQRMATVLRALAAGPRTVAELARRTRVAPSTVADVLRRAVRRGWVARTGGGSRGLGLGTLPHAYALTARGARLAALPPVEHAPGGGGLDLRAEGGALPMEAR